ncbi:MAG: hypothetical protein AAF570_06085, partial [Bacteroidota bacterium]
LPEEAKPLALYFNRHYRMHWAMDVMLPFMKSGDYDEQMLFIFITTAWIFEDLMPKPELVIWFNKALKMNRNRLCTLLHDQYQMLRVSPIKDIYCAECAVQ